VRNNNVSLLINCDWTCFVANYFCSETRFVEVVEHACDENSQAVRIYLFIYFNTVYTTLFCWS